MTLIVLSVLTIIAGVISSSNFSKKEQIRFIILVIIIGVILVSIPYIQTIFKAIENIIQTLIQNLIHKGSRKTHISPDKPFWFQIILYFFMLAGMLSKYILDSLSQHQNVIFTSKKFIKSLIISPLVYAVLYQAVGETTPSLMLILLSYQNGFFWYTILDEYKAKTSKPNVTISLDLVENEVRWASNWSIGRSKNKMEKVNQIMDPYPGFEIKNIKVTNKGSEKIYIDRLQMTLDTVNSEMCRIDNYLHPVFLEPGECKPLNCYFQSQVNIDLIPETSMLSITIWDTFDNCYNSMQQDVSIKKI